MARDAAPGRRSPAPLLPLLPALARRHEQLRSVGIGLIEEGGTALVELRAALGDDARSSAAIGELLLAVDATEAEVVLAAAGDLHAADGGALRIPFNGASVDVVLELTELLVALASGAAGVGVASPARPSRATPRVDVGQDEAGVYNERPTEA